MTRQATKAWDLERYVRSLTARRDELTRALVCAAGDEVEPLEDELIRVRNELARLGRPCGEG